MWFFRLRGKRARSDWIELPIDATLEDLHYAIHSKWPIRRSYDGLWETEDPDDHAHGFWLSGKPWTGAGFTGSPSGVDDDLPSTLIQIEQLDLAIKQKIAYVYDFGEQVVLELTVEGVVEYEDLDVVRSTLYGART